MEAAHEVEAKFPELEESGHVRRSRGSATPSGCVRRRLSEAHWNPRAAPRSDVDLIQDEADFEKL